MSLIRITWHDREVRAAIKRMRTHGGSFAPVFKGLGAHLRRTLKAYAAMGKGPDGKWPPRAPGTDARAKHRTGQSKRMRRGESGPRQRKLVRRSKRLLGRLPSATTIRPGKNGILAISKVRWSGVHNEGGKVGRHARLPRREFVFISPAFAEIAVDRMADFVVREFGR